MQKGGADGKPVSDQWLPPFVIVDDRKKPVGTVEDGDAVVCDILRFAAPTSQWPLHIHEVAQLFRSVKLE